MILVYISILLMCWLLVCLIGHGYANTVDQLSYWLHRHAEEVRRIHGKRTVVVRERWVRELERGS